MDQFNEKGEDLEQEDLGKELLNTADKIDLLMKKVENDLDCTWADLIERIKTRASQLSNSLRELAQDAYGEY